MENYLKKKKRKKLNAHPVIKILVNSKGDKKERE
jgi:hypothetical protein